MASVVGRDEARAMALQWRLGLRAPLVAVPVTGTTITIPLALPVGTPAYGAIVTPSWLTTVAVPIRTLDSMRVDFGTAAPPDGTIDVAFFRADR